MRIISGSLKGRVLKGYNIEGTRPTMDRVKESIMASIQEYMDGSVVLDLFAGSGNLGIEAISNGCKNCYFVDYNKECIKVIKNNIHDFGIEEFCYVLEKDYHKALEYFRDHKIFFDIIFVDPPYRYQIMDEILGIISSYHILSNEGIIVFEYKDDNLKDIDFHYHLLKNKKYGDKYVSIYQYLKK